MNKIYCLKCNRPTTFESKPGAFCSHCGKPYISTDSNQSAPKPQINAVTTPIRINNPTPKQLPPDNKIETEDKEEYDDDDSTDITVEEVLDIDVSKIGIEMPRNMSRSNREDIAQLVGTGKTGVGRDIKKIKGKRVSKKQVEENWQKSFPKNNRRNSTEV